MLTLIIFVTTIIIAAILGLIAYRVATRLIHRIWLRVLFSGVSGGITFLLAIIVFIYYGFMIPATDSILDAHQEHLKISLFGHSPDNHEKPKDGYLIEIFVPNSVGVNQDFSFRLLITEKSASSELHSISAILSAPDSAMSRTLQPCKKDFLHVSLKDSVAACSYKHPSMTGHNLTWDITPTHAGSIVLAAKLLNFPPSDGLVDISKPWHASIEVNGREIVTNESGSYVGPIRGSAGGVSFIPFKLTAENPTVQVSNFHTNLSSMQFRVPVEIHTTLGTSERTYIYMSIVGTILAGAFGTGWFWKLAEIVRSPRKRTDKRNT